MTLFNTDREKQNMQMMDWKDRFMRRSTIMPQLLELRRLENQRALIVKWNGQLPTVQTGQNSGLMLQLPHPAQ